MSDLEQRVKTLEAKVKILEETLETLKNMGISEQMESFINQKNKTLKMVSLLNSVSNETSFDFGKQEEAIAHLRTAKHTVDEQIKSAVKNAGTFSDDFPDDPRYFTYELESGIITDWWHENENVKCNALTSLVGKGIRITGYNGFETERIVVPKEIEGLPVLTIGEKAFINAPFSELILPKTIKALLRGAFSGCINLKHIDLPEELTFIDRDCFQNSGLEEIVLPNLLRDVAHGCFSGCKNLTKVVFGTNITKIDTYVFNGCSRLKNISLPESLKEIGYHTFTETAISILIIPQSVKTVSHELFAHSHTRTNRQVTCVFLGTETEVTVKKYETFYKVDMIYCLPGSAVQKFAREQKFQ